MWGGCATAEKDPPPPPPPHPGPTARGICRTESGEWVLQTEQRKYLHEQLLFSLGRGSVVLRLTLEELNDLGLLRPAQRQESSLRCLRWRRCGPP
jgi:hypothetical protein